MALVTLTERTPAHRAYKIFFWALLIAALIYAPYFASQPAPHRPVHPGALLRRSPSWPSTW